MHLEWHMESSNHKKLDVQRNYIFKCLHKSFAFICLQNYCLQQTLLRKKIQYLMYNVCLRYLSSTYSDTLAWHYLRPMCAL